MSRAIIPALGLAALACLAQTGSTPPAAISAYFRLPGNTAGPFPYKWLVIDPPLSLYVDAAGSPHLGLIPAAPVPVVTDAFTVNCAASQYCAAGVPQTVFSASQPAAAFWGVFRNGLFMTAPQDYTSAVAATGIYTITFTGQTMADQDLVVLFYSGR
jgi:hypothetical protein